MQLVEIAVRIYSSNTIDCVIWEKLVVDCMNRIEKYATG